MPLPIRLGTLRVAERKKGSRGRQSARSAEECGEAALQVSAALQRRTAVRVTQKSAEKQEEGKEEERRKRKRREGRGGVKEEKEDEEKRRRGGGEEEERRGKRGATG